MTATASLPSGLPSVAIVPEASHAVHFYESEDGLRDVVVEFLADGLAGEGAAVVIATAAHRLDFIAGLAAGGFDVERARADGRLVLLDARATLSQFMVGDAPDGALFRAAIEPVLDRATAAGAGSRQVRAYGEMVDVLWRGGNPSAAIQLEELWNDLLRARSFSLLCAYVGSSFDKEDGGLRRVCETHTHVRATLDGRDYSSPSGAHLRSLVTEIGNRKQVEHALRRSLRDIQRSEESHRRSEDELRDFIENAPLAIHWIGPDGTILWANRAELELLGYDKDQYIGRPIADFHVERADAEEILARLHNHEELHDREATLRARDGSTRYVLISSNVCWKDGQFLHTRCFTRDLTERKRAERARDAHAQRTERLKRVTAAIADAVTPEQVFEAVVDQVGTALGASSSALWLVKEDSHVANLCRANGYSDAKKQLLESISLDGDAILPVVDAIRHGQPIWLASAAALVARYPHLADVTTPGRNYSIACLPIATSGRTTGRTVGVLAFTFDDARPLDDDEERTFLSLVARYSGQALERLRLLEAEQVSRARAELLYGLAASVIGCETEEEIFEAALDAIERALGTSRASILVFDAAGVMRFRAWRNLSDAYRQAVEGHSPWPPEAPDPQPIISDDALSDPAMEPYRPLFLAEGIGALGFIPLVAGGRLIGKFMVYYERPRTFAPHELDLARAIANHAAAAICRFNSVAELQRTVRFNEMFTGILGHDLRNPLSAILTSARVAMTRDESERLLRPLSRILSSGDRMMRMINQLLDFTRVRLGAGIPLNREAVQLTPLIRQVMDELDDANPAWTLRLEESGDTSGTWDPDRLSQVFSNLVANAVQHGVSEGGVNVKIDGTARDCVRIDVHNAGAISAELLPRVFEPLMGQPRRLERSHGMGLGLYITKEIVRSHGGEIAVRSDGASGTTFTVALSRGARAGGDA